MFACLLVLQYWKRKKATYQSIYRRALSSWTVQKRQEIFMSMPMRENIPHYNGIYFQLLNLENSRFWNFTRYLKRALISKTRISRIKVSNTNDTSRITHRIPHIPTAIAYYINQVASCISQLTTMQLSSIVFVTLLALTCYTSSGSGMFFYVHL